MKKLESIELLHANGDSTVLGVDSILDLSIEEVTQNWDLNDESKFEKTYTCLAFHLEVVYHEDEEDKDVVEDLLTQKDIVGFILAHKNTDKLHQFEVPYIEKSEEDSSNIFELAYKVEVSEIIEGADDGDRILLIDIDLSNEDVEEDIEEVVE